MNKADFIGTLYLRQQLASCVKMQGRSFEQRFDGLKASIVWCMGHWLLRLLSDALHAGTAGSDCLPPVGCSRESGEDMSQRPKWKGRETWCWNVSSFYLKLSTKRCGRSGYVVCVLSYQKCGQVCSISFVCVLHLRIHTYWLSRTRLNDRVVALCQSRC